MPVPRPSLVIGGTLLTFLAFTALGPAQGSSPALTNLYTFTGPPGDGALPEAALVIGSGPGGRPVLYGTTNAGGPTDSGTVFSLTPPASPGSAWTEAVLYSFQGGKDGSQPYASLAIGSGPSGRTVLYGATVMGGASSQGTVFSLTPPASPGGAWTEAVLYSFQGGFDGAHAYAGVVIGKGGVLYGTTADGGYYGAGTAFSLTPPAAPGGAWTEAVLYSFAGHPAGIVMGSGGVLYGSTGLGSFYGGTIFSLTPPASPAGPWTETVLHDFPLGSAGLYAAPVIGKDGVLYGTTEYGGSLHGGTVFELRPPASPGGTWTKEVLYNFPGHPYPTASLVIGSGSGGRLALYGATLYGGTSGFGTLFSLAAPAAPGGPWTEAVLYNFTGMDGANPDAALVIGKDGLLYGSTPRGGTSGYGNVFSLKP